MNQARDGAGAPPRDTAMARANDNPDVDDGKFQSSETAAAQAAAEAASVDLEERVCAKARELWILEGRLSEDGQDKRHWDMARQLVLQDEHIPKDARFEPQARPFWMVERR